MSDYGDENVLGGGTLSYATETRQQPAPREYICTRFYVGKHSDSYRVDSPSTTGNPATVGHYRKNGNLSCRTCNTANQCPHTAAVAEWLADTSKRVA